MGTRVLVGVPTQTLHAIDEIPEGLPESWVMSQRYLTALTHVGIVPLMVPLLDGDEATLRALYDRLDGVFLAGGVDMEPSAYGQARTELCGRTDSPRDVVEMTLARWAMTERKPVLGVCRGLHVVNVVAGGTLVQDCEALRPDSIKHDYFPTQGYARDYLAHVVEVEPATRLGGTLGTGSVQVNSMHHQGIQDLGRGLSPVAVAPDGLIEAVESTDSGFLVAVQWHPEALLDQSPGTEALFRAFADACVEFRDAGAGSSRADGFAALGGGSRRRA